MTDPAAGAAADVAAIDLENLPAGQELAYLQRLFKEWGLYNQKLTVPHEGNDYAVTCHDTAFVVYRLLSGPGNLRGAPGWPVCLVTAEGIVDECSPPFPDEDCFASHLGLADWLAIIKQYYVDV